MYQDDEDESEEEDEEDEDINSEDIDDQEDASESGSDEDEIPDDEEDEEMEDSLPPIKKSKQSATKQGKITAKEQDEKAMMSQLKEAASADVEKGRDVKKQLAFCDTILEARIQLQKAVTAGNSLPQVSEEYQQ